MSARRVLGLGALLVACVSAACIIGPKQDDPAEDRAMDDGGLALDSAFGGNSDTSVSGADAPAVPEDAASSSDTSTTPMSDAVGGDAAEDAGDGSDAAEAGDAGDAAEGG